MGNKYDLICMDLDGTLLDEKKQISERAKKALYEAKERGIYIAFISGRMLHAVELIEKQLGFKCIEGSSTGTYITTDGKCIESHTMDCDDMLFVYDNYAKKYNIPLWIYQANNWYVTEVDEMVENESKIINYSPEVVNPHELARRWKEEGIRPNKVLIGADEKIVDEIKHNLESADLQNLSFARSAPVYLEIAPKGVTKGTAIAEICNKLNLDVEKTIAFGDQELDVSMIQAAKTGVAMGNAPDHVKEVADIITLSNEEDGVAVAMEKYVLN
mgnify:FL=1